MYHALHFGSVVLVSLELCTHQPNLTLEHFISPKRNLVPIEQSFPQAPLLPPVSVIINSLSVPVDFLFWTFH